MGYSADEMIGRTMPEFCFPEDAEIARERIRSNLGGASEQFDFRLRRKDGAEVFMLTSTSPVRDGSGNIIGALGMFSDITDRKRAAEALRQTQERLMLAQEAGRIAVWEWDLRTDMVTLFREIPALAAFSGTGEGRTWRRAVHPEDRLRVGSVVRQAIANCGEYETEYRLLGV
jgi:PAS domain-containing protein